jgi:hypothetical protein
MGNTRNTGYLQNVITVSDTGNIAFMSGSTMLMSLSNTGQMSGSVPVLSASTASFVALAQSASNAVSAATASFANAFTVANTLTAQTLVVQTITSSVDFVTGSTRFGSILGNTHTFTGSMNLTGSLTVTTTGTELQVNANGVNLGNALTDSHVISGSLRVNPNGLFVSSSGFVGIGNTTPIIDLQIGNRTILQNVVNAQSSYANNVYYSGVNWFLKDAGTGTAIRLNSPGSLGDISFHTIASGSAGANVGTEMDTTGVKMIIKNNGRVGVGTTTPSTTFGVRSAGADGLILEQDSSSAINSTRLFFSGSGQTFALFNNEGDWRFTHSAQPGNTSGTSLARFTNTGKYFRMEGGTGGIQFQGATASTSALNYYEEGNWTPQLAWSVGGNYVMSGVNAGRYVRVGSMVHLQFQLQWSSLSGPSGGLLRINSIPFTAGGTSRSAGSISANNGIGLSSGYTWLGLTIDPGANFIYIIENASAGGYNHGPNVSSSGIVYSLTITYSTT